MSHRSDPVLAKRFRLRPEEPQTEAGLRRMVTAGFAIALVLSALIGFVSWRNAQQASADADWVAHTYEVCAKLELTMRHLLDVETGVRGFALTGDAAFREPFESGKSAFHEDLRILRALMADNAAQQLRLTALERQAQARVAAAEETIAHRQRTGAIPGKAQLLRSKSLMDAARATIDEIEAEERRLLAQRAEHSAKVRRLSASAILFGSILGSISIAIAGAMVNREVGISAHARAQMKALNADLDRRVAERTEALGESEGRLASVIGSAMDSIITVDSRQRIVLFNAAAVKLFRCTQAEALGQPIEHFIPERFRAGHAGHIREFGDTGTTGRTMGQLGELSALRANGEEFQIEASISQAEAAGEKVFTVILRDVTERKHVEQALREKERLVSESQRIARLGSWTYDPKDPSGRIVWSEEMYRIYGVSPDSFTPTVASLLDLIFPDDRAAMQKWITDCAAGQKPGDLDYRAVLADGTVRFFSGRGELQVDAAGQPLRMAGSAQDISERKNTAEALRLSEERLRLAVDGAGLGTWHWNLETGELVWSPRCLALFGVPPDTKMSYEIFRSVLHPGDRDPTDAAVQRSLRDHSGYDIEYRAIWPDGSQHWIAAKGQAKYNAEGKAVRMEGVAIDVTERRHAEEMRERLAAVVDSSDDAIIGKDLHGIINAWNQGAEQVFGYTSTEVVGQPMLKLFPPELVGEEAGILARIRRGESVKHYETVRLRKDGNRIDVAVTISPIKDSSGAVIGASTIARDITERRRTEARLARHAEELARQTQELAISQKALQEQTVMFEMVLSNMGEGLIAADRNARFLIWNEAARKLMGRAPADVPSEQWTPYYRVFLPDGITPCPPDDLPLVRALRGESVSVDLIVEQPEPQGQVNLEVAARPMRDGRGELCGGVAVLRDVTQRKADEQEIRSLNENLERKVAERTAQLEIANKELESFSYSVSHDLRAPLRHIIGFSQMLQEEYGSALPPDGHRYLDRIQAGTQKMGQLVDELLNLARVGRYQLNRRPSRLKPVVEEVIALLEPDAAGRNVEWVIDDLPEVECDPVLVKQVFQNLMANALKFTRPPGSRTAAGQSSQTSDAPGTSSHPVIRISCREQNGQHVFVVRDNGIGFDMKYVDKLFGVFQRLHRAEEFEGTGIGLATVQRIVHKHGGRVWAEGEVGKGAAFSFTLAAAAPNAVSHNPAQPNETQSNSTAAAAGGPA